VADQHCREGWPDDGSFLRSGIPSTRNAAGFLLARERIRRRCLEGTFALSPIRRAAAVLAQRARSGAVASAACENRAQRAGKLDGNRSAEVPEAVLGDHGQGRRLRRLVGYMLFTGCVSGPGLRDSSLSS
jgi:hypothetical protein